MKIAIEHALALEKSKKSNIWKESYAIRSYEVNSKGSLSIISLCHLMQEAAEKHAITMGLALEDLRSDNLTWVLSRFALKIDAYPGWKDQIQVYTWPSGIQRLFALRDFLVTDQDNRPLAASVSAWLIINAETRRPVRMQPFIDKLNIVEQDHVLRHKLDKLPELKRHGHGQRFRVRYRDLDLNQHVNNVSYIEWVVESVPSDIQNTSTLSELEINFQAEAFFGDHVVARCHPQSTDRSTFLHNIIREGDNQEVVRAKTAWRKVNAINQKNI
ncbi:MAG: hypothetical protein JRI95_07755 [Deltaproteobacteria bacterium]|nr:hypothetical protein [Deltaproteobacteria bacterium]